MQAEKLELIGGGLALFLFILLCYVVVVWRVFANMRPETQKLSILVARLAMFLPVYAFFMWIAVISPHALVAVNIPIAVMEGYSFYLFFALIVCNMGGAQQTVQYFKENAKPLVCCNSCCPEDPVVFYKKSSWAMFHLLVTRVLIVVLAAVAAYAKSKAGLAISALLNLAAAVLLFYCLAHLLLLYENLFTHCTNLYGVMKLLLLKFSVGLIVLQGIIEAFMVSFNAEPYTDDSDFSAEEKTVRGYAMLVLIEFAILCIPYLWAYTYTISDPPKPINETGSSSFCSFACRVLNVFDVFNSFTYNEELTQALASSQQA